MVLTTDGRIGDDLPISLIVVLGGGLGLAFAASCTELFHRNRL